MKKYLFGLFAIAFAIAIASFTTETPKAKNLVSHFYSLNAGGDRTVASDYTDIGSTAYGSLGCSGTATVCKIEANESGTPGQPILNVQSGWPTEDGTNVFEVITKD